MFEKLLSRIARALDSKKIPYMIIGGQAVLLYGIPRLTEDIDITLGADVERLDDVLEASKICKLGRVKGADDGFVRKTNVLVCIDPETNIRVDFIFSFLEYERQAIERARKVRLKGYKVNFASVEDVVIHKIFAARPRDLEDVNIILSKYLGALDSKYIKKWLRKFSEIQEYSQMLKKFESLLKKLKKK